jgi:ABC-2 type transport system ATP-binding protein
MLRMEKLTKNFGVVRALKGVDLTINEGEVFGFIGPNGAGKTTAIRILLGVLRATGGNASVFGLDAWKDAVEIHKRLAYVPGDVSLWQNLTGGEVIDLFASIGGGLDKDARARLTKDFDLDTSKKCRTYSKGNRQKVALIAAFASNKELYVLDEPTSGLDPLMEQVFQGCVADVKKRGGSVFLSSHILSEVERLCDRVGIIRDGELVESGTLDELRHLTRNTVAVKTSRPIEGLEKVNGVHDVTERHGGFAFQVESDELGNVITYIAPFGVTSIESAPPTLEDLFMRHYGQNQCEVLSMRG